MARYANAPIPGIDLFRLRPSSGRVFKEYKYPLVYSEIRDDLLPDFEYEGSYSSYARRLSNQLGKLVDEEYKCFKNNSGKCLSHNSAEDMIASKPYNEADLVMEDPVIYPAILEPSRLDENSTQVVIAIPTAPSQFVERAAIRSTWCNTSYIKYKKMCCMFYCAQSEKGPLIDSFLKEEAEIHNDIVQFSFRNSYLNLTRLQLSTIAWTLQHFPSIKYFVRSDSDMFVNSNFLIRKLIPYPKQRFIYGILIHQGIPIRHPASKYYLPTWLFPESYFPPYLSGCFYIWSKDVMEKVIEYSKVIRPIHYIDDVYYGQIFRYANLTIRTDRGYLYWDQIPVSSRFFRNVVAAHRYSPIDLMVIWKLYQSYCSLLNKRNKRLILHQTFFEFHSIQDRGHFSQPR